MRAKRSGRAGRLTKWRKHGPGAGLFGAAVSLLLLLCIAAVLPVRAQTKRETLCFPLKTTQYRVSDDYGWREDPFTGETAFHRGIDLACAEGTAVLAAEGGVVTRASRSASYGNVTILQVGQVLGTAGQTGRATGAHLHFELWEQGTAQAPAEALGLADEAS